MNLRDKYGDKRKQIKHTLYLDKTNIERPYKQAVLRDRNGDLTQEWYIEFYVYSESDNDLVRKRSRIPAELKTDIINTEAPF